MKALFSENEYIKSPAVQYLMCYVSAIYYSGFTRYFLWLDNTYTIKNVSEYIF